MVPPRQKQGRAGETIDSPQLLQSDSGVESVMWKSNLKVEKIKNKYITTVFSTIHTTQALINIKGFFSFEWIDNFRAGQ